MFRHLLVAFSPIFLLAPTALSQETNSERWDISAALSYTDQSGNRSLRLLTGGVTFSHLQKEAYRLDASIEARYGESGGEVIARNYRGSLAFDFRPKETWSPFVFADAERDPFKRLDARLSSGAGAKYTFYRAPEEKGNASVSLAALYSHENLDVPTTEGLSEQRSLARWSLRLKGSRELREGLSAHHVTFYQPLWDEMADYLLRSETGLKVLLMERLALSVVYQFDRNSQPPSEVESDDRILKTGLIIDF